MKYRSFRALVLTICLSIVAQVQAQTLDRQLGFGRASLGARNSRRR